MDIQELINFINEAPNDVEITLAGIVSQYKSGECALGLDGGLMLNFSADADSIGELTSNLNDYTKYILFKLYKFGGCVRADLISPENGYSEPMIMYLNLRSGLYIIGDFGYEVQTILRNGLTSLGVNINFIKINELPKVFNEVYYSGEVYRGKFKGFC